MSHNEQKVAIRAELPQLDGYTYDQAYKYFKPLLGEPKSCDEWDNEIVYFRYDDEHIGNLVPIKYLDEKSKWGIDLILGYGSDYGEDCHVEAHLNEIDEKIHQLSEKFGVTKGDVKLVSYSWYNGCDEPIYYNK